MAGAIRSGGQIAPIGGAKEWALATRVQHMLLPRMRRVRLAPLVSATTLLLLAACSGRTTAPATQDPFASVGQQAATAYDEGLNLYQQGRYSEAADDFNRARLLSPTEDPRIDDMLQRTNAILTPTATPAPPTPQPTDAPTPIVESSATPAADLADSYFGQVFLAVVPGDGAIPVPLSRFSVQDQMGLYVENLNQRLNPAFTLRIFDARGALVTNTASSALARFQNNFVWYHTGGEPIGSFHLELYAGDVLAYAADYEVGAEPVVIPTATPVPTPVETRPQAQAPAQAQAQAQPAAQATPPMATTPVPPPPPRVVLVAAPSPVPHATLVHVAAGPSALALSEGGRLYVADRSGSIWSLDGGQLTLKPPFQVRGEPVALAVDETTSRLVVVVRGDAPAVLVLDALTGDRLRTTPLASQPGEAAFDPADQLLAIVLPDAGAVETISIANGTSVMTTDGVQDVTGLAVDAHTLYVAQLEGDVTSIDLQNGAIMATLHVSDIGLAGLAMGGDQLYAINAPGQTLIAIDPAVPSTQAVSLPNQPAALAFDPNSNIVSVLTADGSRVMRLNPADGSEVGELVVSDDALPGVSLDPSGLWQRPRLSVNPQDDSLYAIEPAASLLALASP